MGLNATLGADGYTVVLDPNDGVIARLGTDANNNAVLVGGDGDLLTFPPGGGIIANVIPRTGTLTNLLTTVAGGVNEVSYATDWDAAVIHNGVVGGARILYCKPKICCIKPTADTLIATSTTPITLSLATAVYDPYSLHDAANGRINVPSGATHFAAQTNVGFAANATGRRSGLIYGSLNAGLVGGNAISPVSHATVSTTVNAQTRICTVSGDAYIYLRAIQDSGGGLNVLAVSTFLQVEFWRES